MKRKKQSKPLIARISEVDETRLWSWFAGYVEEVIKRYGVEAFEILHPGLHKTRRKDRPVVQARGDVVLAMRNSVWYRDTSQRVDVKPHAVGGVQPGGRVLIAFLPILFSRCKNLRCLHFGAEPHSQIDRWKPISYPMLAALFVACDHTTMMYIHRAALKRRAEAPVEQPDTEPSDERNRNSDSSGDVCGRSDSGVGNQGGGEPVERARESVVETG